VATQNPIEQEGTYQLQASIVYVENGYYSKWMKERMVVRQNLSYEGKSSYSVNKFYEHKRRFVSIHG
jgi:MoxR-like ATPase